MSDEHSVDRRGFLQCMTWAGTGLLWSVTGGVLSSRTLGVGVAEAQTPTAAAGSPATATAAPGKKSKTVTMNGVTYADHGTKDVRKLSRLELEADDYYFGPTFLRGNPGQKLTLIVESEAGTLHNITIPALGIDKDIPPKGKVRLDVTFPASGALAFFCKFHGPLGMNGRLLTGDTAPSGPR